MIRTVAAVADPKKQLEWEARQRPRAGIAAAAATLLMILGIYGSVTLAGDTPKVPLLPELQRALRPGPIADLPTLQLQAMQYVVDHQILELLIGVAGLLASVAAGWALGFLGVATRARRPEASRWIVYLPIAGGILSGLYTLLSVIVELTHYHHVLGGARTVGDATQTTGIVIFAQILGWLGLLTGGVGYVLVSLNAMRVGLLTRMLGVIGIAVGAFLILQLPLVGPLLQIIFQAAIALLYFGVWMGRSPPAWESGKAEPWEPRTRPAVARPAPQPSAKPATAPAPAAHPRRKRKKR